MTEEEKKAAEEKAALEAKEKAEKEAAEKAAAEAATEADKKKDGGWFNKKARELEAVKAKLDAAEKNAAQAKDQLLRMAAEYENYRAASARRTELLYNRKALSQVLDSFSRLFVAGKRSWLDVLNAVRELTQSEVSVSDAEATMIASAYKLRLYSGQFEWYGTPNRMGSRDPG